MQKRASKKSEFARILGELRRETGFSQRQAAMALGISQAVLSHYENGAREPKLEFVVKACDYYGVTSDYLLGRTKERRDSSTRFSDNINTIVNSLEELKFIESGLLDELRKLT